MPRAAMQMAMALSCLHAPRREPFPMRAAVFLHYPITLLLPNQSLPPGDRRSSAVPAR